MKIKLTLLLDTEHPTQGAVARAVVQLQAAQQAGTVRYGTVQALTRAWLAQGHHDLLLVQQLAAQQVIPGAALPAINVPVPASPAPPPVDTRALAGALEGLDELMGEG